VSDEHTLRILTGLPAQIRIGKEPIEQAMKPDSL
jgi:hypothetical protein